MLFFLLCITSRHRRVCYILLLWMINHLRNPIEELIVFQQNLNILIFEWLWISMQQYRKVLFPTSSILFFISSGNWSNNSSRFTPWYLSPKVPTSPWYLSFSPWYLFPNVPCWGGILLSWGRNLSTKDTTLEVLMEKSAGRILLTDFFNYFRLLA